MRVFMRERILKWPRETIGFRGSFLNAFQNDFPTLSRIVKFKSKSKTYRLLTITKSSIDSQGDHQMAFEERPRGHPIQMATTKCLIN